eukprot:UN33902
MHFGASCRLISSKQSVYDRGVLYFLTWLSGIIMVYTVVKVSYDSTRGGTCNVCVQNVCMEDQVCAYKKCEVFGKKHRGTKKSIIYKVTQYGFDDTNSIKGTIVITGGSGTLGNSMIAEAKKQYPKHRIVVMDVVDLRNPTRFGSLIHVRADITNAVDVERCLTTFKPDIIFHLAAIIPCMGCSNDLLCRVNIGGTLNLLTYAKQCGTRKFILSSSMSVMISSSKREWYDLNSSSKYSDNFLDHYAETKAICENFIMYFNDPENNFYTVAVRLPALVGWGDEHFTMATLKRNSTGRVIVGLGETKMDFLEVMNASAGLVQV